MHHRGEKISRYLIRVCHMRQMKAQLTAMRERVAESRRETARYVEWAGKQAVRERRLVRIAVVAVLACPGSFVAGGYFLKHVIQWWF